MKKLSIAIMLLLTVWIADARGQNVLHLWIDTVTIAPGTRDVFVGVRYSFTSTHAHSFRGYNLHIGYDPTQVGGVDVLFDGTASAFFTHYRELRPPEIGAVALSDGNLEVDFSKSILFTCRMSVSDTTFDTTFLRWTFVDIPDSLYGIDKVIAEDGWIRVARPHVDLNVAIGSTAVRSDSEVSLPVVLSGKAGARLRAVRSIFNVDTTRFSIVRLDSSNSKVTFDSAIVINKSQIVWNTTAADSGQFLQLPAVLGTVRIKAKHRLDTVCSSIALATVRFLNPEALVGKIVLDSNIVCIEGAGSIQDNVQLRDKARLSIAPNPAKRSLKIYGLPEGGLAQIRLYDFMGHLAYLGKVEPPWTWNVPQDLATGLYEVFISGVGIGELSSSASGSLRTRLLLVH